MIEDGTVIGNVSRTHHPCGACGELVESCGHYHPWHPATRAIRREANARQREAAQKRLLRQIGDR